MSLFFFSYLIDVNFSPDFKSSAFYAMVLTLVLGGSCLKQFMEIFELESDESLDFKFFSYDVAVCFCFFVFGFGFGDFATMFNGLFLGGINSLIVVGIWKYGEFSLFRLVFLCASLCLVPVMVFIPYQEMMMLGLDVVFFILALSQLITLWKSGRTGAMENSMNVMYFVSDVFWAWHMLYSGKYFLAGIICANGLMFFATIVLWTKYWIRERKAIVLAG